MLGFSHSKESETAEYLCRTHPLHPQGRFCLLMCTCSLHLHSMWKDWGVQHQQIGLFTTDGAANIRATVERQLNYPWTHCATHMIDLIVCKALKTQEHVRFLLLKVKKIAKHFQVCFAFILLMQWILTSPENRGLPRQLVSCMQSLWSTSSRTSGSLHTVPPGGVPHTTWPSKWWSSSHPSLSTSSSTPSTKDYSCHQVSGKSSRRYALASRSSPMQLLSSHQRPI